MFKQTSVEHPTLPSINSDGEPPRASADGSAIPHHWQRCMSFKTKSYTRLCLHYTQEKLNEAVMVMNKGLQEVNIQNMNVELVAQMFKNYQSNVLFHLEGIERPGLSQCAPWY
ncbi:unnamed protein product [Penicillium bialowiezense]